MIEWILDRFRGEADAVRTPIGYLPTPNSLDLNGLESPREDVEKLFVINRSEWYEETDDVAASSRNWQSFPPGDVGATGTAAAAAAGADRLGPPGAEIRPLAAELNDVIERENPHVFGMLSDLGKRLFFPKGILAQSAEAKEKATRYDAAIGIARENGKPMFLPSVMDFSTT